MENHQIDDCSIECCIYEGCSSSNRPKLSAGPLSLEDPLARRGAAAPRRLRRQDLHSSVSDAVAMSPGVLEEQF